jgi:hypothetical protein
MITDLIAGWAALEAALPRYQEAEDYFDGCVDEVFASPRVRMLLASTGERYRFNLAKTAVQVMADRVELSAVTAPDNPTASARIEEIWDANDLDVHYPDLIKKVFIYGDAYFQVWPVLADAEPVDPGETIADDQLVVAGVELSVLSPKHCRVIYDAENMRRKAFAIKRWCLKNDHGQDVWRVDLWYPEAMERWVSMPDADLSDPSSWGMFLEEDEEPDNWLIENPYGEIPFIHHRNDLPYGLPEHFAGYGCQDAVNKMLITQITTADSHGWPQRYALTDKGAALDSSGDDPDWDDDTDADNTSDLGGGVPSSQRSGPGTTQIFDGMKSVGEFTAANPAVFLTPAELYVRLMAQLTTTPLHYFDPSGDAPSGESLKTAEAPLVKKIGNRTVMLRGAVVETWTLALRMVGVLVERLDVRWSAIQSATGLDDWQVIAAKQAAGVPMKQTLVEAGYEAEQVDSWLDQEAEAMALANRVNLLNTLGDAITKISSGIGAGVLDEATANQIITNLVGQVAPAPGTEETG